MADPKLKSGDLFSLKGLTKDDEINELKIKTVKHDYEHILKDLKNDSELYSKKYKNLNKKNILLFITEIWVSHDYLRNFIIKSQHWCGINK